MLQDAAHRHLCRMLLTYSDLCETDKEIAACLTFMRLVPPTGAIWTAALVRQLMPSAYSTVTSASSYAANPTETTAAYCTAVAKIIKARKDANAT